MMPERSPKKIQDFQYFQFEYFQGPGILLDLKESYTLEQTPRLLWFNGSMVRPAVLQHLWSAQETWYDPDYDEICTLEKLPKDRLWRSQFPVKPDAIRYPMPSKRSLVWCLFVHFSTASGLHGMLWRVLGVPFYWHFIERELFRRPPLHKPFIGMKLEPGECPEAVRITFPHFWEAVIGSGTDVEHVNSCWHERYICRGGDYDDKLVTDLAATQYSHPANLLKSWRT